MDIDIFICIQIGPSQQKQTHIPFICLSFAKGGFVQRLASAWRVQMTNSSVLALCMLRSNLQGREFFSSPTLAHTGRRKTKTRALSHNLSAFQIKIQGKGFSSDFGRARTLKVSCRSSLRRTHAGMLGPHLGNEFGRRAVVMIRWPQQTDLNFFWETISSVRALLPSAAKNLNYCSTKHLSWVPIPF